jgi:FkbM family methyltransferase
MRINEILASQGVREVVDICHDSVDMRRPLGLSDGVQYRRHAIEDAEKLELSPDTVVLSLIGPTQPGQTDPDDLVAVLRRFTLGTRGVILLGWPIEALPYHRLLGPLVANKCQVVDAAPLDLISVGEVRAALVIERVERLAPIRPDLAGIGRTEVRAASSEPRDELKPHDEPKSPDELKPQDELSSALRLANELILADLVTATMRRQLVEATGRAEELKRSLARAEARITALEVARRRPSTTSRIARAVIRRVRHPGRAVAGLPNDLARVWRRGTSQGRTTARRPAAQSTPPAHRVVPIALPATGHKPLLALRAPSTMIVARRLAESGLAGYEGAAMACFLAAADVAGPGAVFDIGANVGIYAAVASAFTDREVRAFEPTPSLAEVARRFAHDNELAFATETVALGASNGYATFYLSESSDSSNSLAKGFRESVSQIQVPVETLDAVVARTRTPPALIKIDTESTEPDVLEGAADVLREHRPWILCEVLAGRVEAQLMAVLAPHGYCWYHITDEIPYRRTDMIVGDRTYQNLMWLFTPEPPSEAFWAAVRVRASGLAECTAARGRELWAAAAPAAA